eukprot:5023257-Pyramimonas_sp.AAC.1
MRSPTPRRSSSRRTRLKCMSQPMRRRLNHATASGPRAARHVGAASAHLRWSAAQACWSLASGRRPSHTWAA